MIIVSPSPQRVASIVYGKSYQIDDSYVLHTKPPVLHVIGYPSLGYGYLRELFRVNFQQRQKSVVVQLFKVMLTILFWLVSVLSLFWVDWGEDRYSNLFSKAASEHIEYNILQQASLAIITPGYNKTKLTSKSEHQYIYVLCLHVQIVVSYGVYIGNFYMTMHAYKTSWCGHGIDIACV